MNIIERHVSPRLLLGLALLSLTLAVGGHQLWTHLMASSPQVAQALMGGTVAALATALGTVPVLVSRKLSDRVVDTLQGFGAGVMLAACAFSLIVPGLEAARDLGMSGWGPGGLVGVSLLAGAAILLLMDHLLPHEHFIKGPEGASPHRLKRIWLFVFAICLHNLPEGLAIGVASGGSDPVGAASLAMGIAIQDVPEGLVVATALIGVGYGRALAVGVGMASGLIEPVGAVLGAVAVSASALLLPIGLAMAAGAMLFVISHEIIPESHRKGHEVWATTGLLLGFVLMMLLDTSLG